MFLRYFAELALPFEAIEAELLGLPEGWIPGVAREANERGERLLAEVGFGPLSRRIEKQVRIELEEAARMSSKTVLPMSWRATGLQTLFPVLEADIEVAALGPNRTQLSISGLWGSETTDHACDLRLRPRWPPVRSVRIAFLEGLSEVLPPTGVDEI